MIHRQAYDNHICFIVNMVRSEWNKNARGMIVSSLFIYDMLPTAKKELHVKYHNRGTANNRIHGARCFYVGPA